MSLLRKAIRENNIPGSIRLGKAALLIVRFMN
jgi:hypothetical protein